MISGTIIHPIKYRMDRTISRMYLKRPLFYWICITILCGAHLFRPAVCQPTEPRAAYLFPSETPITYLSQWKQCIADSLVFKEIAYNDAAWTGSTSGILWSNENSSGMGVRWFRKTIFIPEQLDSLQSLALYQHSIVCASELYWDGRLISQNGKVGNSKTKEIPGVSSRMTVVSANLTNPGRHVLALRMSNYHTYSGLIEGPLQIGYLSELLKNLHGNETVLLLCAGIFLISALFHFAVMFGRATGPSYALFGLLCLSSAAYLLIDITTHYFPFSLRHYYTIALVNDIPWFCMMTFLPVFFLYEFSVPYRKSLTGIIGAIALFCIVPPRLIMFDVLPASWLSFFVVLNQYLMYTVTLIAAVTSFINSLIKKQNSLLALAGCVVLFFGIYLSSHFQVQYAWAVAFCILIVMLTISLSRRMALQNRQRQENELRSARLELDLLKKHIQPHFLLNSLNSIIAWLEEDPQIAAKLVHALAGELRAILDFSSEKLISVNDEIRLCKLHLQVMGFRRDAQYELDADAAPDEEKLPPLIFHTLLENALTHSNTTPGNTVFSIKRFETAYAIEYHVSNIFETNATVTIIPKEGTGIKYVKTRLQEAFPNAWEMSYGPIENKWEVKITVKKNRRRP